MRDIAHDIALRYYGMTINKHVQLQLGDEIADALRTYGAEMRRQGLEECIALIESDADLTGLDAAAVKVQASRMIHSIQALIAKEKT